ncbi:hypothetical protein BDW22DRAFT_1300074, partial [Trametopsis cervina]
MNTVNASTGFAPFQLLQGRRPRILPLLLNSDVSPLRAAFPAEADVARNVLAQVDVDVMEAQDNLLLAKLNQARAADPHWSAEPAFKEGERVLLSTLNRRCEYMQRGDHRVAK